MYLQILYETFFIYVECFKHGDGTELEVISDKYNVVRISLGGKN